MTPLLQSQQHSQLNKCVLTWYSTVRVIDKGNPLLFREAINCGLVTKVPAMCYYPAQVSSILITTSLQDFSMFLPGAQRQLAAMRTNSDDNESSATTTVLQYILPFGTVFMGPDWFLLGSYYHHPGSARVPTTYSRWIMQTMLLIRCTLSIIRTKTDQPSTYYSLHLQQVPDIIFFNAEAAQYSKC